jgi:hypothetical protein
MTLEEELFARHLGKSVLLDSNLLLVLVTGTVGTHLFGTFERVRKYGVDDFELLARILSHFTVLVTTPHIITEVSNLANKLWGPYREEWYSRLALLLTQKTGNASVDERWEPSKHLAGMPEFVVFGITDCALTDLAPGVLVLTDDYRLAGILRGKGMDVLNFLDLRALRQALS